MLFVQRHRQRTGSTLAMEPRHGNEWRVYTKVTSDEGIVTVSDAVSTIPEDEAISPACITDSISERLRLDRGVLEESRLAKMYRIW